MTTHEADQITEALESWPPPESVHKCPYPYFERARETSPVYRFPVPHPSGRAMFLVTGWAEAAHVLTHSEEFDADLTEAMPDEIGSMAVLPYPDKPTYHRPEVIAFTAGDDHTVKRSWTDKLFEPARMVTYEPIALEAIDRLIDGFIAKGTVDFTHEFAEALPLDVLTTIMGMPTDDAAQVKEWTDTITTIGISTVPTPDEQARLFDALDKSSAYALHHLEQRIAEPRQDYLTEVLQEQMARDGEFDQNAMVVHVRTMFLTTYHTAAALLSGAMLHLVQEPGLQQKLRENRSQVRKFLEEVVRLDTPLQFQIRRAVVDTTVGGVDIPAGSIVFPAFAAANRDPGKYPAPDEFELSRPGIMHHLGFGSGDHRCPGAPLARLYGQVAFNRLLDRMESIELDTDASDLEPLPGLSFRIPTRVAIRFTAADID